MDLRCGAAPRLGGGGFALETKPIRIAGAMLKPHPEKVRAYSEGRRAAAPSGAGLPSGGHPPPRSIYSDISVDRPSRHTGPEEGTTVVANAKRGGEGEADRLCRTRRQITYRRATRSRAPSDAESNEGRRAIPRGRVDGVETRHPVYNARRNS